MNEQILLVDDEQNVLDSIKRQLRKQFQISTAPGANEALDIVKSNNEFAVILSDMRMPGKDGVQFFREIQQISPNSTRIMLTGNADQKTAADAVNQGSIFRFLTKPCDPETLRTNLQAGIRQYELITAEKQLLEQTLKGSINVLVDILALTNPAAFSRAERIKHYVKHTAIHLKLAGLWQYEVAALLSQIGYVTVPTETMEKYFAGDALTEHEQSMLAGHATEACRLIANIPRMEDIAQMIATCDTAMPSPLSDNPVITGAQIIRAAKIFDLLISRGSEFGDALKELRSKQDIFNQDIVAALSKTPPPALKQIVQLMPIRKVRPGMILAEDIRSGSALVVSKGQVINKLMHERLSNFAQQGTIDNEIRVHTQEFLFNDEQNPNISSPNHESIPSDSAH